MERRSLLKGLTMGAGALAAGAVLPVAAAKRFGPAGPETDDPRNPGFWEEDAGPWPEVPRLEGDLQTEVAIIGSGITGLSATWTLKELRPELKVCVLDSHRPCSGASTRNSAHLFPSYNAWKNILASHGAAAAQEWNAFARRAVEAARELIQREGIDCGLHPAALIWTGTARQEKTLRALAAKMKQAGLGGTLSTGPEFQARSGLSFYFGGIEVRENYIMHPGRLMKGLLEKVMARGVQVFGRTPVLKVKSSDSASETNLVLTPAGTVAARQVLVATNAYTPRLDGTLSSRIVPVVLGTIATEPLGPSRRGSAPGDWEHFTEIQLLSRTLGHTPEGRVYLRGIFGYCAFNSCVWKNPEPEFQKLTRQLHERVPGTKELKITHRWLGAVAMTFNSEPISGPLSGRGLYFCGGYNGHGMPQGFYNGRLVAHLMLGADHPDLKYLRGPSGWIPPEPYRALGAKTFFWFGL